MHTNGRRPNEPNIGDVVVAKHHPDWCGTVIELRGPLGPNGEQMYRVRFGDKRSAVETELLAEQVRVVRVTNSASPTPG